MSTANFNAQGPSHNGPWHYLVEWVENTQSRHELMTLSDRELSDIGLERTYGPVANRLACTSRCRRAASEGENPQAEAHAWGSIARRK